MLVLFFGLSCISIGNLLATVLARRVGKHRLIMFSLWMMVVGVGIIASATSLTALFAVQLFIGLSQGVNFPRYVRWTLVERNSNSKYGPSMDVIRYGAEYTDIGIVWRDKIGKESLEKKERCYLANNKVMKG